MQGVLASGLAAAVLSLLVGCADPARACFGQKRSELIYGEDTRLDVYAVHSELLARLALRSTVAFMPAEHLVSAADGRFDIVADTLGSVNHLCPDEAFATQPAAATCSGVLVDDRLVLTAGHCAPADGTCDGQRIVFDYAVTDPVGRLALDGDAIYRCRSVPIRFDRIDTDGRRWDYAFIELDRSVDSARLPVELAGEPPPVGSNITVIGAPSGLPIKVDPGAQLLHDRPCGDYFTLSSDTFEASSGSGVFDDNGRLMGVFSRGDVDYEFLPERRCAVARRMAKVADPARAEQAGHIAPAIAMLCASGWSSDRLCAGARAPGSATTPDAGACSPDDFAGREDTSEDCGRR